MSGRLDRLGRACAAHGGRVVAGWVLLAVLLVVGAHVAGTDYNNEYLVPGSQSKEAIDRLQANFPALAGSTNNQVVFQATTGTLTDPNYQQALQASLAAVAELPGVSAVGPPSLSADNTIGFATVAYAKPVNELPDSYFDDLENAMAPAVSAGLQVDYGGDLVGQVEEPTTGAADKIGLGAAMVMLLIAFGSVVAAGLPIVTAIVGIGLGLSTIELLSTVVTIPSLTPTLATMIGLGVGIDYALFIISRHRDQLAAGVPIADSIGLTNATSGQSVVFAGTTVVIAICCLALAGVPFLVQLGLATTIVVIVAVIAAITLMPALLGVLGPRINNWPLPWARHRAGRQGRAAAADGATPAAPSAWARWADRVGNRPWPYGLAALVVLLALAAPVLSMRLGNPDNGSLPTSNTQRRAYDLLTQGFGPGFNGPLLIVVELPANGDQSGLTKLQSAMATTTDVATLTPPQFDAAPPVVSTTAAFNVIPKSSPQDPATTTLVHTLRDQVIPTTTPGTGARALVSGSTAVFIDLSARIAARLPVFIGVVILLSFVLLMLVFRSVVIPLTAAFMNVLTVGVAYGILVAVFQWGWFIGLIGLDQTVPISSFVPMMMFAVVFGLSMDYEVFLMSRIRESWARSGDTHASVVEGVSSTAKVITSAALIMASVFFAFLLVDDPIVKMFGIGLAAAVLIDSTLIRMVLVPAIMELLGDSNWWLPKGLGKVLPHLDLEGTSGAPAYVPAESGA